MAASPPALRVLNWNRADVVGPFDDVDGVKGVRFVLVRGVARIFTPHTGRLVAEMPAARVHQRRGRAEITGEDGTTWIVTHSGGCCG